MEPFWAIFRRSLHGVYQQMSAKHLQAYVDEYDSRQRMRDDDTLERMTHVVARMVGRRLTYSELNKLVSRRSSVSWLIHGLIDLFSVLI